MEPTGDSLPKSNTTSGPDSVQQQLLQHQSLPSQNDRSLPQNGQNINHALPHEPLSYSLSQKGQQSQPNGPVSSSPQQVQAHDLMSITGQQYSMNLSHIALPHMGQHQHQQPIPWQVPSGDQHINYERMGAMGHTAADASSSSSLPSNVSLSTLSSLSNITTVLPSATHAGAATQLPVGGMGVMNVGAGVDVPRLGLPQVMGVPQLQPHVLLPMPLGMGMGGPHTHTHTHGHMDMPVPADSGSSAATAASSVASLPVSVGVGGGVGVGVGGGVGAATDSNTGAPLPLPNGLLGIGNLVPFHPGMPSALSSTLPANLPQRGSSTTSATLSGASGGGGLGPVAVAMAIPRPAPVQAGIPAISGNLSGNNYSESAGTHTTHTGHTSHGAHTSAASPSAASSASSDSSSPSSLPVTITRTLALPAAPLIPPTQPLVAATLGHMQASLRADMSRLHERVCVHVTAGVLAAIKHAVRSVHDMRQALDGSDADAEHTPSHLSNADGDVVAGSTAATATANTSSSAHADSSGDGGDGAGGAGGEAKAEAVAEHDSRTIPPLQAIPTVPTDNSANTDGDNNDGSAPASGSDGSGSGSSTSTSASASRTLMGALEQHYLPVAQALSALIARDSLFPHACITAALPTLDIPVREDEAGEEGAEERGRGRGTGHRVFREYDLTEVSVDVPSIVRLCLREQGRATAAELMHLLASQLAELKAKGDGAAPSPSTLAEYHRLLELDTALTLTGHYHAYIRWLQTRDVQHSTQHTLALPPPHLAPTGDLSAAGGAGGAAAATGGVMPGLPGPHGGATGIGHVSSVGGLNGLSGLNSLNGLTGSLGSSLAPSAALLLPSVGMSPSTHANASAGASSSAGVKILNRKQVISPLDAVVLARNKAIMTQFAANVENFRFYGRVDQRDEAFDAFKLFCAPYFFTLVFESRGETLLALKCSHAGQYKDTIPLEQRKRQRPQHKSKKDGCGFACALVYCVNGVSCSRQKTLDPTTADPTLSYWAVHHVSTCEHATHALDDNNLRSDFQFRKVYLAQLQDEVRALALQEKSLAQIRKENAKPEALSFVQDEDLRNAAVAFIKRGNSFGGARKLRDTKRYSRSSRRKEEMDAASNASNVALSNINMGGGMGAGVSIGMGAGVGGLSSTSSLTNTHTSGSTLSLSHADSLAQGVLSQSILARAGMVNNIPASAMPNSMPSQGSVGNMAGNTGIPSTMPASLPSQGPVGYSQMPMTLQHGQPNMSNMLVSMPNSGALALDLAALAGTITVQLPTIPAIPMSAHPHPHAHTHPHASLQLPTQAAQQGSDEGEAEAQTDEETSSVRKRARAANSRGT